MKALLLEKGELMLKDIPSPLPLKEEVLLKVLKAGICSTDLEMVKGYMDFEGVPGHEFVGKIVESSEKTLLGKRVVGEINIACGKCELCQEGSFISGGTERKGDS